MHAVKRFLDLVFAIVGLAVLSPLLLSTAMVVAIFIGRPILFQQVRPGFKGRPFVIYKFRTMTQARDAAGVLRPDSERLTRTGRILRALSLDELPELVNIARGEMSFVGPRPLLMDYLPLYSPKQRRRHDLRPGLTGWAQVNGRNAADWQARLAMDVWYVDHWSLWLDAYIVLRTVWKVLSMEGISQPGYDTVESFAGNPPGYVDPP